MSPVVATFRFSPRPGRRRLGEIEPHARKFPIAVEQALFALLLTPWEDLVGHADLNWRAFQTPWVIRSTRTSSSARRHCVSRQPELYESSGKRAACADGALIAVASFGSTSRGSARRAGRLRAKRAYDHPGVLNCNGPTGSSKARLLSCRWSLEFIPRTDIAARCFKRHPSLAAEGHAR